MSCEYCSMHAPDGVDELHDEISNLEVEVDELKSELEDTKADLKSELEDTKADLHFAAEKCLIPLVESYGATRAEVLLAMGNGDPVTALRKLVGEGS